jgi:hypothetical protein
MPFLIFSIGRGRTSEYLKERARAMKIKCEAATIATNLSGLYICKPQAAMI